MQKNIVITGLNNITNIIHLSDIHIRLFKRHNEYKEIFDKLYQSIQLEVLEQDKKSTIIVISGDIVHNKTDMSPEMISLTSEFLEKLSNIYPTLIIAGNHDANLNNLDRLDAISPMVNILSNKLTKLYYLKDTGIYKLANIDFAVYSIMDENCFELIDKSELNNEYKVALYHGTINGATSESGIQLKNDKIKSNYFDGYDIVCLGDIHLHQIVQERDIVKNKPYMLYPSTLIQQGYGETYENHGYILWTLHDNNISYKYINIENNQGYYTLNVQDNKILEDLNKLPLKPRLRFNVLDNTQQSIVKELLAEIKKTKEVQSYVINKLKIKNNSENIIIDDNTKFNVYDIIGNLKNITYQNQLIENYILKNNTNISKTIIEKIKSINTELNNNLKYLDITRNIVWKLDKLEFSDMFTYGKNNIIDFTKMNDICGLFAANASGKSSIVNIILFCLFDKCVCTTKAFDIMNYSQNEFYCKLSFIYNLDTYYIERKAVKDKKGKVKVDVNFYYVNHETQEQINLNGKERAETNKIIQSKIGTFDQLMMTSVSAQGDNAGLINTKQAERKDLLMYYFEIDIFDKILELANKELKTIAIKLKDYGSKNFNEELNVLNNQYNENNEIKTAYELSIQTANEEKNSIINERIELEKKLIKLDDDIKNINTLLKDKEKLIAEQKINQITINNKIKEKEQSELRLKEYNYQLNKQENKIDLQNKLTELKQYQQDKINIESKLSSLYAAAKIKKQKMDNLNDLEYDENCTYCMNNIFVKDAINTRNELELDRQNAQQYISKIKELEILLETFSEIEKKIQTIIELENNIKQIETAIIPVLNSNIESYKKNTTIIENKLSNIEQDINKYYRNEQNILHNIKIEQDINEVKLRIKNQDAKIYEYNDELKKVIQKIAIILNKIDNIKNEIIKYKELEEENIAYNYYTQAINRQGIPFEILSEVIHVFEQEVNNILNQMVDFQLQVDMSNDDVDMYIDYGYDRKWALELTSGMERFISSIAIRVALMNISNLPKLDNLILDEGFGVLDTEHINIINQLFDYLKQYFNWILIITHIDSMKDNVDTIIELKQNEDRYSQIIFN